MNWASAFSQFLGPRRLESKDLWTQQEMGTRSGVGSEGCHKYSVEELGMGLGL